MVEPEHHQRLDASSAPEDQIPNRSDARLDLTEHKSVTAVARDEGSR
jgi:hypothetical protein